MNQSRGPWYLFTGLVLGLAIGLLYAWLLEPIQYVDASPRALNPTDQAAYRNMIALAYQSNEDYGRASTRLAALGDEQPALVLRKQAEVLLASGGTSQEAQALVDLAVAVQSVPATLTAQAAAAVVSTPSPPNTSLETPSAPANGDQAQVATVESTRQATFTPRPTANNAAGQEVPYVVLEKEALCDGEDSTRIAVEVRGAQGQPLGGVPITITWANNGSNTFYTGLHPQISAGYADFEMQPGEIYTLRVGKVGEVVSDLQTQTCESGAPGGWQLVFGVR
jgi:hypothetical protein